MGVFIAKLEMPVPPNKIKDTTSPEPDTITVGGFKMGTSPNGAYGPTSVTDFWQGITPSVDGYTVYETKASQGPSMHTPQDDAGLIFYANYLGAGVSTIEEALDYFATNAVKCVNIDYPDIVTSGLTSLHDFGYVPSCPLKGATVYGLGQDAVNGTVSHYDDNNRPYTLSGYNGSGSYISFGTEFTNNHMDFTNSTAASDMTVCMLFRHSAAAEGFPLAFSNSSYDLRVYLDEFLLFRFYNTDVYATTPGAFPYGEWVFAAFSFTPDNGSDNLQTKVWTDGFLRVESLASSVSVSSGNYSARVGGWLTGENDNGLDVMAVMTYSRLLTQEEVAQNFSAYASRYQVTVDGTSITLPEINYTTDGIRMNLDASDKRSYYDTRSWIDLAYPDTDIAASNLFDPYRGGSSERFFWYSSDGGIYSSNTVYSTTVSSIASYNLPSFTVEVWARVDELDGTKPSIFSEIGASGGAPGTFAIYVDPADSMIKASSFSMSSSVFVLDSGIDYTTGLPWKQIVYTFDNSTTTASLYIDSSLKNQQNFSTGVVAAGSGYRIGGSYDINTTPGTEGTRMGLSVIRIYEKALSQQEITRNYNAVSPRFI